MANARQVFIVGDVVAERNLYRGTRLDPSDLKGRGTRLATEAGGAWRLFDLIRAAGEQSKAVRGQKPPATCLESDVDVRFGIELSKDLSEELCTFALWTPCGEGDQASWRCAESLGYGHEEGRRKLAPARPWKNAADVTLIDDAGFDLRWKDNEACWPKLDAGQVIVKLSTPQDPGALWERVIAAAADRTTVIVNADDLRATDVRLTQGISWERTALELVREARNCSDLMGLCRARHLIVRFDLEGALHLTFGSKGETIDARLVYDAAGREGSLRKKNMGDVIGLSTAFAAGLGLHMDASGTPGSIMAGIQTGLAAANTLHEVGHGPATAPPVFPREQLVSALLGRKLPLPVASVPLDLNDDAAQRWTIPRIRAVGVEADEPLYGLAHRLAEDGLKALWDVPREVVGDFVTVDRSEIESLRALMQLIEVYTRDTKDKKPLSIGVFGPPGAGKSFAVEQMGKQLLHVEPMVFNLSQFSGSEDLIGALHQVRDVVLTGAVPLVFWDEFDSDGFEWLQYLLAPMQDGRFQEGQLSHPIGRCVFVFAGGTSPTFDTFGTFEAPTEVAKEELEDKFRLAKGPDFKSRLSGYLDVLGPNPRLDYSKGVKKAAAAPEEHKDVSDVAFPLRRALMVRGMLGGKDSERLDIDKGLLAGLLEVGFYEHGSRSLQKTLYYLKNCGVRGKFRRSDLPAPALLDPHVAVREILELAGRSLPITRISSLLADRIHFHYKEGVPAARYREEFEKLPPQIRADNYAASERIGRILSSIDLELVERDSLEALIPDEFADRIKQNIGELAEREHDGWQDFKHGCGWRQGPRPANKETELLQLQHHLLVPFRELPPDEQKKDHDAVMAYVDILDLGGWAVAERSDLP